MARANLLPSLGEGFKLIVREPLSVFAWGVVSLIAAVLPLLAYWALVGPDMFEFYASMARASGEGSTEIPTPPTMSPASGLVQLLQYLLAIVSGALVYAGIYRAVINPQDRGFGHLKFSMEEVHVGVVLIVMFILMMIVMIAGGIIILVPLGIGLAVAAGAGGGVGMAVLIPILVLALLVGFAILYSRFGMALPMTFAEKRIRIFEAWTFTKGYAGQLLAMALLQVLIVIGLYLAVIAVAGAVMVGSFAAMGANGFDPAQWTNLVNNPEQLLQRFLPLLMVAGVLYLLVVFVMQPIMLAPWAKAYQLIAADRMKDETEVFA